MLSKEIRYMLAIQKYGSITKAAESLYITQSALSKAVKNVEQQTGSPLFSRIGNDLVPTYLGRRYMEYAGKVNQICSDWHGECQDLLGELKGRLTIAVALMRGSCLIPDILSRFYSRYPQVQIHLLEEAHSVEKQLGLSPDIDFAIYNDTSPHPSQISELLGREEIVLVASGYHPLRRKSRTRKGCRHPWLDIRHTKGESYVLHAQDQTTGRLSAGLFQAASISPRVLLQTRNSDIAIRLAASGAALCLAPESYVRKLSLYPPPACFSVGSPCTVTTLYVVYQKGRYLPSYGRYFIELAKEYMEGLPVPETAK